MDVEWRERGKEGGGEEGPFHGVAFQINCSMNGNKLIRRQMTMYNRIERPISINTQ